MTKPNEKRVDLSYPRCEGNHTHITVHLMDVRASDGIRLSYDFERDGWVVEQPQQLSWDADDEVCDLRWRESAFIPSWQYIDVDEDDQ